MARKAIARARRAEHPDPLLPLLMLAGAAALLAGLMLALG